MIALLIAAIGALVAGALAIVLGVPVKEFSFGNTLILAGVLGICTGLVLFGQWMMARELRAALRGGRAGLPGAAPRLAEPVLLPAEPTVGDTPPWPAEPSAASVAATADEPAPPQPASPPEPDARPKRNLLFQSTSRRERERANAAAVGADPALAETLPTTPLAAPAPASAPQIPAQRANPAFEDAWPQRSRETRQEPRPAAPPVASPIAPPQQNAPSPQPSQVTVLKSGVVDGMAYSLYSDGSIEAQLPEGMMRFASIDALRDHLDHRPA